MSVKGAKILALDSGVERTGFAVFEGELLVEYGCIVTEKQFSLEKRIGTLHQKVEQLCVSHDVQHIVMERLFFSKNVTTGIMVAQAQGAVMVIAADHDVPVTFISPTDIKMHVTGYGRSDKKNIQKMIEMTVELSEKPKYDDTYDAIACGIAFTSLSR